MNHYFNPLLVLFRSSTRLVCLCCKYLCLKLGNLVLRKYVKIQNLIDADKKPQIKEQSAGDNLLKAIQALSDIPVEYIRRAVEQTEAGKAAIATNSNRRLYAVLQPTREENIQRIKNTMDCMGKREKKLWSMAAVEMLPTFDQADKALIQCEKGEISKEQTMAIIDNIIRALEE